MPNVYLLMLQLNAAYNTFLGHALPFPPSDEQQQEEKTLDLWIPPPDVLINTREDHPAVVMHLYGALGTPCMIGDDSYCT